MRLSIKAMVGTSGISGAVAYSSLASPTPFGRAMGWRFPSCAHQSTPVIILAPARVRLLLGRSTRWLTGWSAALFLAGSTICLLVV